MTDLTGQLKAKALAEGFDLVGIADASADPGVDRLRSWLEAGHHAGMDYMRRTAALRADPGRLLAGCQSVVAVAMSYRTSLPSSAEGLEPGRVWVSRYAWGRDYHRLLKKRLVHLGHWLAEQCPGCGWRACVDTAPALERGWAAAAGLGWIGKNASLINQRLGSELFLGLLMTDVALAPNAPVKARCGRCTACLDACPTAAFAAPGVIDSRRCVGYLTVEHHGDVPNELRPGIGRMVAGCDVCQEICPWTRRAPANLHPDFSPAPHRHRPLLAELEALDEKGYRDWRRGSPLNRIPFVSFRRNLEVARRNVG